MIWCNLADISSGNTVVVGIAGTGIGSAVVGIAGIGIESTAAVGIAGTGIAGPGIGNAVVAVLALVVAVAPVSAAAAPAHAEAAQLAPALASQLQCIVAWLKEPPHPQWPSASDCLDSSLTSYATLH